jgi:two-component system CheB/CheR fusion protein
LAICRGIVELHGGQIVAHSRGLGQGARFLVELGVIAEPEQQQPEAPRSSQPTPGKSRILLVEDHEDTAEMLNELLSGVPANAAGSGGLAKGRIALYDDQPRR